MTIILSHAAWRPAAGKRRGTGRYDEAPSGPDAVAAAMAAS